MLFLVVVISIGCDRIVRHLTLVRHAHGKLCHSNGIIDSCLKRRRNVSIQPTMHLVRLVNLAIAFCVDITERQAQSAVPHVIAPYLLGPLSAGMFGVSHLPGRLLVLGHVVVEPLLELSMLQIWRLKQAGPTEPVCRAQHLCTLQDHLHDMLVTVVFCCTSRILIQHEGVHDSSRSL